MMKQRTSRRRRSRSTVRIAAVAALVLATSVLSAAFAPASAQADPHAPTPILLNDFEASTGWELYPTGGASASFAIDGSAAVSGSSAGRLDLTVPSGTVELSSNVTHTNAAAVQFSVLSENIDTVAVRLVDSTGQLHQQQVALDPEATGWQTITIADFTSGPGYVHWDGANDGVWHGPLTRIGFVVDKWGTLTGSTTGSLKIDALTAYRPAVTSGSILFVGNSFTHGNEEPVFSYNNAAVSDRNGGGAGGIPGIFKKMTDQAGLSFDVDIEAASGQTLGWHYSTRPTVIGEPWTAVVLQEQSTLPLPTAHGGNPTSFATSVGNLRSLVQSGNADAEIYLYETWASPTSVTEQSYPAGVAGLQAMQADLRTAYLANSGAGGAASVSPVGDAFLRAVDDGVADGLPSDGITAGMVNLWSTADLRHPSRWGGYLSAAVMFARITQLDPRTLPTGTGSAAADLEISAPIAAELNRIAYETTTDFTG
ncbi:hypothetical protein [Subtercola endophyticus]|uniref:hypothetical protein n=1 Tax=Subtercola endophyticus TaxID=2895559 RepID=UPI001E2AF82D|nr:hypothetical protein [Subtercola endophyticus]UFS60834.1 hypothetical protein LQ955_08895 [Subtercola endophyticus]